MRILVAYATPEGQTQKIAEAAARRVRELGHEAELFNTGRSPAGLQVNAYDKIVVAGSVHQQQHPEPVEDFVVANLAELQKRPTLFFLSISLSAAFAEGMTEAQGYVDAFLAETGWTPTQSLLVAGALQHGEYDYFKAQIIEHVVLKGRQVNEPARDHEFTDWAALARAVKSFVRGAKG
jgi:menaquinone-dependent protoporphyrinogen oxidase